METGDAAHSQAGAVRDRLQAEQQRIAAAGGAVLDRRAWRAGEGARRAADRRDPARARRDREARRSPEGSRPRAGRTFSISATARRSTSAWKYGEREIRHWHGLDEGYAARKPLLMPYRASSSISSTRWSDSTASACPRSRSTARSCAPPPACCTASCERRRLRSASRRATRRSRELAGGRAPPRAGHARYRRSTASPHFFRELGLDEVGAAGGLRPHPDRRPSRGARGRRGFPGAPRPAACAGSPSATGSPSSSNFDYTPTALDILGRAGVVELFDTIVVSDEVGWRKRAARYLRRRARPSRRSGRRVALVATGPTWTCWAPSRSEWTRRGSTGTTSLCRPGSRRRPTKFAISASWARSWASESAAGAPRV